jgi:hypothetical protein
MDIERRRARPEQLAAVSLRQFRPPGANLRIASALIEPGIPARPFVQEVGQHVAPLKKRGLVLELRDAACLAIGHVAAPEGDRQDTEVAGSQSVLGKFLGRIRIRGSVLHRIHDDPGTPQRSADVCPMFLEILIRGRHKRLERNGGHDGLQRRYGSRPSQRGPDGQQNLQRVPLAPGFHRTCLG